MARRRRKQEFDVDAFLAVPWQAWLILSVVSYVVLAWIIPALIGSNPILKPLGQVIHGIAWIPASALAILAGIFYFAHGKRDASSPQTSLSRDGMSRRREPHLNPKSTALDSAWEASLCKPETLLSPPHEWSVDLLRELEWKRFELVCAAYYQKLGFRVETIRAGADGGIDAKLFWGKETTPSAILQCKAWNTYQVGVKPARELLGVMAHNGVSKGIFLATGTYTKEAIEFARNNPIELVTGEQFVNKVKLLSPADSDSLLKVATTGDYLTPTCPSCGIKMVMRSGSRGQFWGCQNFPRCRQRFAVREPSPGTGRSR